MDNKIVTDAANQIFDASVNPLANIVCGFLALQVRKGYITKEEAKYTIASSADVLSMAEISGAIRETGADMLLRMIRAIDQIDVRD